ncbi:MAG: hemerythrin family protein [Alphaproteobacteria bacterium]|nr:hemerythrin family protein [Alphaproteobacteria bacterium]
MPEFKASPPPAARPFELPVSALFGDRHIDAEHQVLVDILNGTIAGFGSSGRLLSTRFAHDVAHLLDHLKQHFDHEEQLMTAARYPGLATHRAHHGCVLAKVSALRMEALQQTEIDKEPVFDLFDQVLDDLLRADLPFKAFLDANGLTGKA